MAKYILPGFTTVIFFDHSIREAIFNFRLKSFDSTQHSHIFSFAKLEITASLQTLQTLNSVLQIKMRLSKKRLAFLLIPFLSIVFTILIQIDVDHYMRIASTQTIPRLVQLRSSDAIYGREWWEKPVVIEEYNLIFFSIPKVS